MYTILNDPTKPAGSNFTFKFTHANIEIVRNPKSLLKILINAANLSSII